MFKHVKVTYIYNMRMSVIKNQTEMERCTIYERYADRCKISCRLGLWAVEGPYGKQLINEATHYFNQYKAGGEYSSLIGGPSVIDVIDET